MPSRAEILLGLTTISNRAIALAILWHVALTLLLLSLAHGWQPSRRSACRLLTLPLLSVSIVSFAFGNPFNGALFAFGALLLLLLARDVSTEPVARAAHFRWLLGLALLAFGWVYPHFLQARPALYLLTAPVGLVPCPTLSVVIGLTLAGGLGTRSFQLTLAALGLFYGLFGVLRLGVWLDVGLLAGALALFSTAVRCSFGRPSQPRAAAHSALTNK